MLVCKKCKTTKLDGKWIPTHNVRKNVTYTLCPICSQEVKQVIQGTLFIDGHFFQQHTRQSLQLIQTEERRARSQNVYSRIVQIQQNRNPVIIKTTNSLLAIQIGKQFKRVFRGRLDISKDNRRRTLVRWIFENGHPSPTIAQEVESAV